MERSHRRWKGRTLNAAPAAQSRLLDLQALDSSLDRLAHRRRTLPELALIEELGAHLRRVGDALVVARTAESDLAREQAKAEADVEQVRARTERDQQRLDTGSVSSARDLESLQSEIASLVKRRSDLEDVVLDVMERQEAAQSDVTSLAAEREKTASEADAAAGRRDRLFAEMDGESNAMTSARAAVAADIPADFLALYEKIRASSDGVGAAALHRGRCEGCHLALTPGDLGRIRDAAANEVLRCEECRRVLVRTAESGL